jgi:CRP/FNR family cyclic AMP-dependent transcriptional regulator
MEITPVEVLSYGAAGATLYGYFAKTMVPLRVAAIIANALFIAYGLAKGAYVMAILHSVLLPINVKRLRQMLRLTRNVTEAVQGEFSMDWLRPFMKARHYDAGAQMFRKGDVSTEAYHVLSGEIDLEEIGVKIGPGTFFGEMGLFTTSNRRTVSARCNTPVEVLFITYDEFRQLYFQQPTFGFYVLRLIVQRMEKNLELARQSPRPAPQETAQRYGDAAGPAVPAEAQ